MIEIPFSPIAFTIGGLSVHWYGIMVALAVLTMVAWTLWQVKKGARLSYDLVLNVSLVGVPSGIIGARLLHVLDNFSYYYQHPGEIVGGSGLAIYGAVLGTALGIWIFSRFHRFAYGYLVDIMAPGIILAQAVGRVGCVLNGCCYGLETDLFCGVVYTDPQTFAPIGVAVHPTQIYEIIYDLIIFFVLLKLRGKFRPDGSLFTIYLAFYAVWRFAVDFIREGTPFFLGLHEAQVVSLVILTITLPLLALRTRPVRKEPPAQEG
ncbi:MAG: prolipoprotein diacylglyceryl transferase [Chloroflexota bacterium]